MKVQTCRWPDQASLMIGAGLSDDRPISGFQSGTRAVGCGSRIPAFGSAGLIPVEDAVERNPLVRTLNKSWGKSDKAG